MDKTMLPLRGGQFQAEVFEDGTGSPLLFLHSEFGLEPGEFHSYLAAEHRLIAPRHPGFGGSTGNERLQDLHDLLYYYLDFLDARGLRNLPLVGHGLGGMFAAELAAIQPERFTRLVLAAPYGVWNAADPSYDIFATTPRELSEHLFHNASAPGAVALAQAPTEQERLIDFMVERAKSMSTAAKYLWPIPNRGLGKRAHRISAPTLLVWGEHDKIVPPGYAEEFRKLIPNASVATIPDSGHLPDVEQPRAFADTILAFLRQ